MKEEKTLDRREFTLAAAMAALSGVVITISSACGGGSSSPTAPSTPPPTPTPAPPAGAADKTGVVGSNHGHRAVITAGQLTAAASVSLNIQGDSPHPHTVELTAAEVASIAANQRVSKESSTDSAHSHSVTFN